MRVQERGMRVRRGRMGMRLALSLMQCMVGVLCNFDILNTTFTFLTKLNR